MAYESTRSVLAAIEIQRESAAALNKVYNDLRLRAREPMLADLMSAGVERSTALALTNNAVDAMDRTTRGYLATWEALLDVASTLEAVEKAKTAAESESPRGKFVIN